MTSECASWCPVNAQADLNLYWAYMSLCWAYMSESMFSDITAHIILRSSISNLIYEFDINVCVCVFLPFFKEGEGLV